MASFQRSLCILLSFFFTLLCFSQANNFNVGGKDGWTLHPSENYNQWSSRLRFIVNDTLHFKYNSGSDSVLVVSKADYDSCNTNSPITSLTGGDNVFNLNRPGPFYFISGNKSNCDQGQKLTVVVISPKTKRTSPAAAPTPSGSSPLSPISSPPAPGTPVSTTPAASPGGSGGGSSSPTGSPMASPGGGIASPPAGGPAASPGGEIASSPTGGPAAAPGGGISSSPTGVPVASPGPGVSASPMGGPADVNGPAPGGSPASGARVAVTATLGVPIAMVVFGIMWVY